MTTVEDLAARLGALGAPVPEPPALPAGRATVVVAGGAGRGKSRLVGALLGRPGLLDAGPTATHVAVATGSVSRVHHGGRAEEVADVAPWCGDAGVELVEVGLRHPLLDRGVTLVDTPGIDGLTDRGLAVTLAATTGADALVLVVDPTCPLTAPELAFLARATERTGALVLVLTGTDRVPGWRAVLEEDRALLARHAPRFADAPVLAVSSALAELARRARAEGRDAVAEKAWERSGMAALEAVLGGLADRLDAVRLRNRLQQCLVAAMRRRATDTALAADETAAGDRAELRDRRARLRAMGEGTARWRRDLARSVQELGSELDRGLDEDVRAVERRFEETLRSWSASSAERLSTDLEDALRAVRLTTAERVRTGLDRVVDRTARGLAREGVVLADPVVPALTVGGDGTARPVVAEIDPTTSGFAGAFTTYATASALTFSSHAVLAALIPGLGPLGLAFGLVVGAGGVVARRRALATAQGRRGAQRVLARALAETRTATARRVSDHLAAARHTLDGAVGEALRERTRALEAEIRDAEVRARRADADRAAERARARTRLIRLHEILDEAQSLASMLQ